MRIHVKIEDEEGKTAILRLRPPGMELETDRMVFGLAVGPLGLSSVLAAIQDLVETVIADKANDVANVRVMDDYAIVGLPDEVKAYCEVMLQALELTGFEATKNWTWNKEEYTKWLGHYWEWDSDAGELALNRETVAIDPYQVTKRGVFESAGAFHAVTESLNESMALAHANTARKLAGKNDGWDSPADALVAKSTAHNLREGLYATRQRGMRGVRGL